MKTLFDKTSYICSRSVTKQYSTSFSIAVKMLSPKIQDAIHAIYGMVRLADEIVDSFHDYQKKELLDEFQNELNLSLVRKISLNPILNCFQEVVNKYQIDKHLIDAFFESMRADLDKSNYNTISEYEEYIYGSADVVGLMCLKIFVDGNQEEYNKLKYSAKRLGSAFQKVNFLRDLKDDTMELNRVYFPHFQGGKIDDESKLKIVTEINEDFEEAFIGIKQLPIEAKFGVYTAYTYYKHLLKKLRKADVEKIKANRIRISNPFKIFLLTKSFFSYKLNLL